MPRTADRARYPADARVEAALSVIAERDGGLSRLLELAWSAGQHAEVCFDDWLDSTIDTVYRVQHKEARRRAARRSAHNIEEGA